MKSAKLGKPTLGVEVTNVSRHGLWIMVGEEELFLSFDQFPWFQDAAISDIFNVTLPQPWHLYWPELDVDLDIDSIRHPERFPLVAKVALKKRSSRSK
jgi:hypothetical protein